jgi:hypothetical protein
MNKFYTCLLLLLTSIGLNSYAQISINVVSPAAPYIVDTAVNVEVAVTSNYSVASVKGTVSGRQTTLTYTSPRYYGSINVADLPVDTLLLTITVTDVLGNVKDTSLNVIHDSPPALVTDSTLPYAVATPTLHIKASATDNDQITSMILRVNVEDFLHSSKFVFNGNSIDTTINLLGGSIIDGTETSVVITATDSRNQQTTKQFRVYVESSPYLERVYTSPYRGKIIDYKYNKVLISDEDSLQHRIVDVQTKAMSAIPVHKPLLDQEAFLTPYGAFFATAQPDYPEPGNVFEFYNGAIRFQEIREDDGDLNRKLVVGGNYAVLNRHFPGGRDPDTDSIVIRDLSTGINRNVLYYYYHYSALLADNGMALLHSGGAYSYNAPQNQLNSTAYQFSSSLYDTDGNYVLYGASNPANPGGNYEWGRLYLEDSTLASPVLLTNYMSTTKKNNPKVNNGYVAYVKADSLSTDSHVFLRDPAGNEQQKTFWGTRNLLVEKIKVLDSTGNFIFAEAIINPTLTPERGYYLAGPNRAATKLTDYYFINYAQGSDNVGERNDVFVENGQFFIAIGNTLFRVNPNAEASLISFPVAMKQDSVYKFTTENFSTNYTGTAPLANVKIISGPSHGVLSISGHPVGADTVIVAGRLTLLRYTPAPGYTGADTVVWNASSDGSTYAANNALITFSISGTDSLPVPRVSGVSTQYCGNAAMVTAKILNPPASGVTITATMDGRALRVLTDSSVRFKPDTLAGGMHQLKVSYSNAVDTTSTTISFTVLPVTIPDLALTANITTVNTPSDTVIITAQVPVGYKNALYTFAWDPNFTNLIQWESVNNMVTIAPDAFAVGNNKVYGKVRTGNACSSSITATDSIVIVRSIVTAVPDTDVPGKMISAYPNPFNGPVTIKGFQVSKQYTLSLYDMQGKLILKKRVYQQSKAEINVQGRGNYILQINDDTKKRLLGSLQIIRI